MVAAKDEGLQLLFYWFLLMLVHQAVKHRVIWQRQLQFPYTSSSSLFLQHLCILLLYIHLLLLPTLHLSLPLIILLHPLLCKAERGTAQYAKNYRGMRIWRGRQTLTGHFHCAPPPPPDNQHIRASFDFPTVWVSSRPQTSRSLYFFIFPSPVLISFQTACRELKGHFWARGMDFDSWKAGLTGG